MKDFQQKIGKSTLRFAFLQ